MIYEITISERSSYGVIVKANGIEKAKEIALSDPRSWRDNQDYEAEVTNIREARSGEFKGRIINTGE